jgi:coenzyme F420 hydrogenase subunit beta
VPKARGARVHRPASEDGVVPADEVGPVDESWSGPAYEMADATAGGGGADDSCESGSCTCGEEPTGFDATGTLATDGGATPANVSPDGELGDVQFTRPPDGVSQDIYDDPPDERVNLPEGVELDTPGYGIRARMSDSPEPDEKTWFMELDEAVIEADRCIQCGTCVAACPSDSIGVGEDDLPKLVKMCTGCSLCWDFCPRGGLRYERQWKITGGEDNVKGAGDPITEFSAKVREEWRKDSQDGGVVTSVLIHLLEAGEIDGALIATESDEEPWKAESFLAVTPEELIENTGTIYNQTLALGDLSLSRWKHPP